MRPKACFCALPVTCAGTPPQVPADALASEVVDSTLAEPVAAAAMLGSAPHASGDVGSESEVPDFAQWRRAAIRFAIWYFADLCRSPPQRAVQPFWTSSKGDEPYRNSPRMPGSMQRNRSLSKAIGMLSRPAPQVLRHNDRVVALRFPGVRWRRKAEASTLTLSGLSASACNGRMIAAAVEKPDPRRARTMLRRLPLQFTHTLFRVSGNQVLRS